MAKPFVFRAEVVLKLREQKEQLARRRLAESQLRVRGIQDTIGSLRGQLRQQDELVRQGVLTGHVDVQYMSHYRRHVMALHRQMIGQVQLLQAAAADLAQVRTELMTASKDRKVMSKLKEKLQLRHHQEVQRVEARATDEMNSMRFAHRLTPAGE